MAKYPKTLGRIEAVWNKLGGEEGVDLLLSGQLEVKRVKYLVDLNAKPFVPQGWGVFSHIKGLTFEFDPNRVKLHLSWNQQNGKVMIGTKLKEELVTMNVYNANLCDFYLASPHLIPEEWKGREVCFWGTIYINSHNSLCVRCLCWHGDRWKWNSRWMGSDFNELCPAAVAQ